MDHEQNKEYLNDAPEINMETNGEASMKNIWRTKLKTENKESSEMMAFGGSQWKKFMKCFGWV